MNAVKLHRIKLDEKEVSREMGWQLLNRRQTISKDLWAMNDDWNVLRHSRKVQEAVECRANYLMLVPDTVADNCFQLH